MRYLLTAQEMRRADAWTMEIVGIPGMVLMERAALAVTGTLFEKFPLDRVLVLCGTGNNGGDGMAAARMLHVRGVEVTVCILGDIERGSEQAKAQARILRYYGIPTVHSLRPEDAAGYTTIVDALFGVGLTRPVEGVYAKAVEAVNAGSAKVLAVDISSGICADTGRVLGTAVRADVTVTFAFAKLGQRVYPGAAYTGELLTADIGIYADAAGRGTGAGKGPAVELEDSDVAALLLRSARSHKGTYGKVLIVAGSRGMAGAAYLSAAGAYRTGCGLVRICTEECNREIVQTLLPEAMTAAYEPGQPKREQLLEQLAWADAVVVGPGMGTGEEKRALLGAVLEGCDKPLVLDADALTLLADNPEMWGLCRTLAVITPHPGELARLLGCPPAEVSEDILGKAREAADRFQAVCVLKDARTVTAAPDGSCAVNTSGSHALATGGSGDVLSGIIGAVLARGNDPFLATAAGVRLHGLAGERAAERKGAAAVLAGDILDAVRCPDDSKNEEG